MRRIKRTAIVRCSGGSNILEDINRETITGNCSERLAQYPEGFLVCQWACLGGGSCESACRLHAISISERNVAVVDRDTCVGCGLCAKACPQKLIDIVPRENVIQTACSNEEKGAVCRKYCDVSCIGCGICEKNCPAGAIHVTDGHAVIDQSRCIACGMCAVKCPRNVIHDANGIFTTS